MHSIEDIYAIIHAAEKSEANGEYLLAYQTYMIAIEAVVSPLPELILPHMMEPNILRLNAVKSYGTI